ncbi:unnamed protein product [Calypogeia fissa]
MESMVIAVSSMASLPLSSVAASLPRQLTKASSSFSEFSGLASVRPISLPSCYPSTSSGRVALNAPLRIEAKEPTRREMVKVRHRRIRKKLNGTAERLALQFSVPTSMCMLK